MNKPFASSFRHFATTAIAVACAWGATPALAANHALIMTIDYAGTEAELPRGGIENDGKLATDIARGMGVPDQNIRWLRNGQLGQVALARAINEMASSGIAEGDKVFLYYSGHGTQLRNTGGGSNRCSEGMVSADLKLVADQQIERALEALSQKASQVVMLNDSCFSGGQASTKSRGAAEDGVPKSIPLDEKAGSANDPGYECGKEVNKSAFRSLGVVSRPTQSSRLLYIAASADNEVARVLPSGEASAATFAWAQCLKNRAADTDRNGIIDGNELVRCAQASVNSLLRKPQTVTLRGEGGLPMSFTASTTGSTGAAPVADMSQTLRTLQSAADRTISVVMSVTNPKLKIKQDLLDFSVRTGTAGYLYLLHIGTDGKFYQLYPNQLDKNNYLNAGTHRFPRPTWGIQAQGPAGKGYFMAYLSSSQRNFVKEFQSAGPFATAEPVEQTVKTLGLVALDGRFGASEVLSIEEVQ